MSSSTEVRESEEHASLGAKVNVLEDTTDKGLVKRDCSNEGALAALAVIALILFSLF
jgi:hypothetical protein